MFLKRKGDQECAEVYRNNSDTMEVLGICYSRIQNKRKRMIGGKNSRVE